MRNYFCEKHGKSVADDLIGRLSQFLYTAVCMDGEELGDAEVLQRKLEGKKIDWSLSAL